MSEQKPRRVYGVPIWGIILLFLGIVFLLQNLGALPWGLWGSLWRFWPVLIIIIGLGILLRRYNVWLLSLLILAVLCACLGIAIWQYGPSPPAGVVTESYSEPLGNIERAEIEVDFTGGSLTVVSLPSTSPSFVEASSEVRNGIGGIRADFHRQNSEGRLFLTTERVDKKLWGEVGIRWEVRLTRNAALMLNIKSAASNIALDFGELVIAQLRLDMDAGNCTVRMPTSAGTTHAYIDADAANIEVTIPEGVAARIRADIDLSNLDIDESRFPKRGDYYVSQNFEIANNRIDLEINCDVGRVEVK